MLLSLLIFPGKPISCVKPGNHATSDLSRLLYIPDTRSGRRFLVDTGAAISVVPRIDPKAMPEETNLTAANGSKISTYGEALLSLDIGLRRDFKWIFVIADVKFPILGADFMYHYGISVHLQS